MKKDLIICASIAMAILCSCGGSKNVANDGYYSNPSRNVKVAPTLTQKDREVREVDKLAAKETDKMRAVGIGNDVEEKYARREALRDAQTTLASYLETTIIALTKEFHKKASINNKKVSETNIEDYVESAVSQKISSKIIGVPEVYDVSDGTVSVYVCVELSKPTEQILGEVYDQLTVDEILWTDYNKQNFIKDNLDRLQELRESVK